MGKRGEYQINPEGNYFRYTCSNGRSFIFDQEDLIFFQTHICSVGTRGYVTTNRKKDLIHHLLLGVGNDVVVDHINGDPTDNRRSNLRIASRTENHWNYRLSSRNTTGFKGIYKDTRSAGFHARICVRGKRHYLGLFMTPELAAEAYDRAAREYFGEYATLNFPQGSEQGCALERSS